MSLGWILDISRGDEPPEDHLTAGLLDGPSCPAGAVALGLGGPEAEWPAALDDLGAVRIGHGVRAMEDPSLVERLVEEQVPVEVSPTSNVLLIPGTAPSIEAHPIGAMLAAGVNVSVNTDDPGCFSTTLTRELALVAEHHGVDEAGLAALQRRAIDASFAPPPVRAAVHAELDAWISRG